MVFPSPHSRTLARHLRAISPGVIAKHARGFGHLPSAISSSSFYQEYSRKMDIIKGPIFAPMFIPFSRFSPRAPHQDPGPSSGCSLIAENDRFLVLMVQLFLFHERSEVWGEQKTVSRLKKRAKIIVSHFPQEISK